MVDIGREHELFDVRPGGRELCDGVVVEREPRESLKGNDTEISEAEKRPGIVNRGH